VREGAPTVSGMGGGSTTGGSEVARGEKRANLWFSRLDPFSIVTRWTQRALPRRPLVPAFNFCGPVVLL
jgi:hypothetical protein